MLTPIRRFKMEELFWSYLHTVTIAHDDMPNEPHRQVIFKEEIPELIQAICSFIKRRIDRSA